MLLTDMKKKTTMPNSINLINAPDLTKRPPRSPRVRLGGYASLPRCLDKGRATIIGKNGEYHFNCPLDQEFLKFTSIDAEELKEQLATGKGDGEILEWIEKNAKHKHSAAEIAAWSAWLEQRGPQNTPEMRPYFEETVRKIAPKRTDIVTGADMLDLDDYVSFGGKP